MANITFKVDDDIHKKMKSHPEIKWTEIIRRSIVEYLAKLDEPEVISMEDLRNQLSKETQQIIDNLDEDKEIQFYEKIREIEKEKLKVIQQSERSENK